MSLKGKVVLVTGGTGTFGKEFIKQALTQDPKQIRVFSRDELKQADLAKEFADPRVEWLIGDVRDYERLCVAMDGVEVVVHAAAMKRVEKCERDPQEAVKTNVLGSINVSNACLRMNVPHSIGISSDKACHPINTYGKTKALMESVWLQANVYRGTSHPTKFSIVRYGNVLGSRGSVIPAFRKQAAEDGVVRLTDERMTRYFLTIQQAVDLVMVAIETQQGGEIYLPELKSVEIKRLARLVAPKAHIVVTQPVPGEKLHEELMTVEESKRAVIQDGYVVVEPEFPSWPYQPLFGDANVQGNHNSYTAERYADYELKALIQRSA
jgi:UDP-N-acetylglucosamine 4,6-dehydratase